MPFHGSVRRPRRLVHRGRRRPRPDPAQRPARLGRPGGRGARRPVRRASATPTSPSAGASCARSSTSSSSRPWPWSRTWSHRTPAPTTSCVPGSTSTPSPRRTTRRSAGSPPPAPRVVLFTTFDPGGSAIYRPMRGRFALFNEAVREIATRHGATLVDFWRMREYQAIAGLLGHRPDAPRTRPATSTWRSRCSTPSASRTTLEPLPPTAAPGSRPRAAARRTLEWARDVLVPVGAPPPHRPVLGRRRLAQATRAGPDRGALPGRVTSPRRARCGTDARM